MNVLVPLIEDTTITDPPPSYLEMWNRCRYRQEGAREVYRDRLVPLRQAEIIDRCPDAVNARILDDHIRAAVVFNELSTVPHLALI